MTASVTAAPTAVLATTASKPRSAATTASSAPKPATRPTASASAARPICSRTWNAAASEDETMPITNGTDAISTAVRDLGPVAGQLASDDGAARRPTGASTSRIASALPTSSASRAGVRLPSRTTTVVRPASASTPTDCSSASASAKRAVAGGAEVARRDRDRRGPDAEHHGLARRLSQCVARDRAGRRGWPAVRGWRHGAGQPIRTLRAVASPDLSVVVPAYQERAGIAATLRALHAALDGLASTHEVLVVDNASPDGTADEVERLDDPRVRVLRNPRNLGKGASVRRGMLEATGALRLHCDADCAPSLAALPRMLALAERVRRRGRLAARGRRRRRPPPARAAPDLRPFVRDPVPARAARAHARPVLRLQALAGRGGRGRLPLDRADRLDVRRRDARDGAGARVQPHRDRDPVDRPARLAAVDAAGIVPVTRELLEARRRVAAARVPPRLPQLVEAAEPRA